MLTYVKDIDEQKRKVSKLYDIYPLIKEIDIKNQKVISENATFKSIDMEKYLSNDGEKCTGYIFIIEGEMKIQRMNAGGKETNLYNLSKGQLCTELSNCFKEDDNLNICARAVRKTEICIIPCSIARKYLKQDINFLRYMYNDLYKKHQVLVRNKEAVRHETLEKRLLNLLIGKGTSNIYATHSELAFEIDSTREVVSRKLKKFEKLGYIKMSRGKIQIEKDLNSLMVN